MIKANKGNMLKKLYKLGDGILLYLIIYIYEIFKEYTKYDNP